MHHLFSILYLRLSAGRFLRAFLFLFLLTGMLLIPSADGQSKEKKVDTLTVIGSAPYDTKNLAGTKKAATTDALAVGVNQVAASLFPSNFFAENLKKYITDIAAKPDAFVNQYSLLAESSSKDRYYVMLKVKVASDQLKAKLNELSKTSAPGKSSGAKILFLVSEQNLEQPFPQFWWGEDTTPIQIYSESGMMVKMKAAGFQIVDHGYYSPKVPVQAAIIFQPDLSNRDALDIGRVMKADVVIVGKAVVYEVAEGENVRQHSYNATLTARAIQVDTGNEIGSVFETVVKQDIDASKGSRQALETSGMNAAAKLLPKISALPAKKASTPSEAYTPSTGLTLMVNGTNNLGNFIRFRQALLTVDRVYDIQVQAVQANLSAVHVKTDQDARELAAALKTMQFKLFSLDIKEVSNHSVKLDLIAK